MNFIVPEPCTIESVNAALIEAGYKGIEIFEDASKDHNISVSYCCEGIGRQYHQTQTTRYETARQWAEDFEAGYFRLQLEEDEEY